MTSNVGGFALAMILLLATGCYGIRPLPLVPSPETRVIGDVRGVVLREGAGGRTFQFSDVSETRWTSSGLIITGTVDAPGRVRNGTYEPPSPDHGRVRTVSFPLSDIDHVLVHENFDAGDRWAAGVSLILGAAAGGVAVVLYVAGMSS